MKSFGKSCFFLCPGSTVVLHVSKDEKSDVDNYRITKGPVNNKHTETKEENREMKGKTFVDSVDEVLGSRRFKNRIEVSGFQGNHESQNGNGGMKDGGGGKAKGKIVNNGRSEMDNMHRDSFSRGRVARADAGVHEKVEYWAQGIPCNNLENQYQYQQQLPDPYYGAPTAPPADEYDQGQTYYF